MSKRLTEIIEFVRQSKIANFEGDVQSPLSCNDVDFLIEQIAILQCCGNCKRHIGLDLHGRLVMSYCRDGLRSEQQELANKKCDHWE
jgi:hypothetical protein